MEDVDVGRRIVSGNWRNHGEGDDVDANPSEVNTPALVLVEWLDAEHEFGWQDGNELTDDEPVLNCFTVGWLLKDAKTHIKVCQTFSHTNHAQTLLIPRGMIVSMMVLKPPIQRLLKHGHKKNK